MVVCLPEALQNEGALRRQVFFFLHFDGRRAISRNVIICLLWFLLFVYLLLLIDASLDLLWTSDWFGIWVTVTANVFRSLILVDV